MAPFDPGLALLARRAGQFSLAFASVWLLLVPILIAMVADGLLWWPLPALVARAAAWHLPLLLYSVVLVGFYWVIHYATRAMTIGNPLWHKLAFASVLAAAPLPAILAVLLVGLAVNMTLWLVWVVIITLVRILIVFTILALLLGALRG